MSDIKSYRLFYLTAKLGSISKAADACHMDRTAAGRRLQQLESEFGKPLFTRGPGGIDLTTFGKEASQKIAGILSLDEEMKNQLARAPNHQINILSSHALLSHVLADKVALFLKENPKIKIHMVGDDKGELRKKHQFDFYFYTVSRQDFTDHQHEIMTLKRRIYASKDYIKAHGHIRDKTELSKHRFIVFGSESQFEMGLTNWPLYLSNPVDTPSDQIVSSVNNVEAMVRLAQSGIGAIGISDHIVRNMSAPLEDLAPGVIENEHSLYMYYDTPNARNLSAKKFIAFMKNQG